MAQEVPNPEPEQPLTPAEAIEAIAFLSTQPMSEFTRDELLKLRDLLAEFEVCLQLGPIYDPTIVSLETLHGDLAGMKTKIESLLNPPG